VSAADVGKGVAAASVGRLLAGPDGANLAAAAAVVGHCHPVGRSGGKGVATSVGQVLGTFPRYLPVDIGVAALTATAPGVKQRSFVATAVASTTWVVGSVVAWRRGWPTGTDDPAPGSLPLAAAASSAVIARRFAVGGGGDGSP
jgi:glycerol-3-phosphate acyltransferase PlsY